MLAVSVVLVKQTPDRCKTGKFVIRTDRQSGRPLADAAKVFPIQLLWHLQPVQLHWGLAYMRNICCSILIFCRYTTSGVTLKRYVLLLCAIETRKTPYAKKGPFLRIFLLTNDCMLRYIIMSEGASTEEGHTDNWLGFFKEENAGKDLRAGVHLTLIGM